MDGWLDRIKTSLFPLSVEQGDIRKALKEWYYTGDTYDLDTPCEDCQLCGHPDIRYQFTIRNYCTNHELLIGSECITRFDIPAISESGAVLSGEETKKAVSKDRRRLILDAKERRMIQTLIDLKKKEETFEIDSFITYYKERGAFTPNQLALLFWRINVHQITNHPSDFKLTIKRDREKSQLLALPDFKIKNIAPCLSISQREFLYKNGKGHFT